MRGRGEGREGERERGGERWREGERRGEEGERRGGGERRRGEGGGGGGLSVEEEREEGGVYFHRPCLSLCSPCSEFVLQVSGECSYIAGQNELLSFKDIRRCIIKGEAIHLSISQRPSPERDTPFKSHVSV